MTDPNPHGDHPALPKLRKPKNIWHCRVCGYGPLDKDTEFCVNCGRDWWGAPGSIPKVDSKPARAGLREGVTDY